MPDIKNMLFKNQRKERCKLLFHVEAIAKYKRNTEKQQLYMYLLQRSELQRFETTNRLSSNKRLGRRCYAIKIKYFGKLNLKHCIYLFTYIFLFIFTSFFLFSLACVRNACN